MNPDAVLHEQLPSVSRCRPPASVTLTAAEYRALVDSSAMMLWRSGTDSHCNYINETWLAFTGRSFDEEIGTGWAEGIHRDDVQRCVSLYEDSFRKREPFEMEYRLRRHDGAYRWIVDRGTPLYDETGVFQGFIGSCVDIDERRRAQAEREAHHAETLELYGELQERDARMQRLADANIVGVVFSRPDSQVFEANDAFLQMLGYTKEDVHAGDLRWRELTPPEWSEVSEHAAAQLKATGRCEVFEKEYFRSDGSRVPVLVGAATVDEKREEVIAFVLDLSERKRAEEERVRLQQAQAELVYMSRVLTMGELAASLTHDITQPIAAALVSADLCLHLLANAESDGSRLRDAATRTCVELQRASEIIDRIRALFTRSSTLRDRVDINELVREMATLLEREATLHGVFIRTALDPSLPVVVADRVQLEQVLLNLMLNAIDAMKGGGGELSIASRQSGGRVEISVSDSGVGIPPEQLDYVFDAFFTTKPQGIGMGLAITRAIVESHGGLVSVHPNPGAGVTFRVSLPAVG